MIPSHIVDPIAAQKIEILVPGPIIKISSFRANVDFIKSGDPKNFHQGRIQMPGMEFIIFTHPGGNEIFKIK
jgi:hypothetical protein